MQGENHDRSARIRHVPIHVESRTNSRNSTNKRPTQPSDGSRSRGHDTKNEPQNNQQPHYTHTSPQQNQHYQQYNHPNFYEDESAYHSSSMPNTSSINIDYKPPPSSRQSTMNQNSNPSANNQPTATEDQGADQKGTTNTGLSADHDMGRAKSTSPNLDKLVNSPEPIPLPPPDQSSEANSTGQTDHNNDKQNNSSSNLKKPSSIIDAINSIKSELNNLLQEINNFSGINAGSKEYRYIDEMLTRCILNLDEIECGESSEYRQHRRTAIRLVDRASEILQRKLQVNSDIHDLFESMNAPSS